MVVGSMVGAGVFQLPARFATQTGVYGALIAWAIAGTGMLALAFVFQTLAVRKPHLDNGVYVYARAGFGVYPGFLSAIGFWASACAGNAFYWVLIMTTVSQLFPQLAEVFGTGDTWPAFFVSVAAVWGYYFLIRRGVKEAAWINFIVTIAKLAPLALFLVLVIFFFNGEVFVGNLTGGYDVPGGDSLFLQVQGTMLITVFVFLGIEGASVYSRYAKRREDVGGDCARVPIGARSVRVHLHPLVVSFPRRRSRRCYSRLSAASWSPRWAHGAGRSSALGSSCRCSAPTWHGRSWRPMSCTQRRRTTTCPATSPSSTAGGSRARRFLVGGLRVRDPFAVQFAENALDFTLDLTAALALAPFALASAYAVKIAWQRDGYDNTSSGGRTRDLVIAVVSTVYTLFLIWAAGYTFLFLACILLAPATVLYFLARREQKANVFTTPGLVVFLLVLAFAVIGIVLLATGVVQI